MDLYHVAFVEKNFDLHTSLKPFRSPVHPSSVFMGGARLRQLTHPGLSALQCKTRGSLLHEAGRPTPRVDGLT